MGTIAYGTNGKSRKRGIIGMEMNRDDCIGNKQEKGLIALETIVDHCVRNRERGPLHQE